ncbi:MAG: hypothetical protein KGL48_03430 [Sphingomonadales bacterium]|nr:hypothetical protein [Sphingomonadales bacterium]MDE2567952.1 hypothetical protein [Sphingomonadales bacterium]
MKLTKSVCIGLAAVGLTLSGSASAATRAASALPVTSSVTGATALNRVGAPAQGASNLTPNQWLLILLALVAGGWGFYELVKKDSPSG